MPTPRLSVNRNLVRFAAKLTKNAHAVLLKNSARSRPQGRNASDFSLMWLAVDTASDTGSDSSALIAPECTHVRRCFEIESAARLVLKTTARKHTRLGRNIDKTSFRQWSCVSRLLSPVWARPARLWV
jgi:hypothetical protein